MEFINKLESIALGWVKNVPHLPVAGQKWLALNVWWLALVGAILAGIGGLFALGSLFQLIALLGTVANSYYVVQSVTSWAILSSIVSIVFLAVEVLLLGLAVQPLKARQKKGWVLLFALLLVNALSVVVNAFLTFSFGGFIVTIIFGAIGLAIGGYFLFEIHGQFAHSTKAATTPVVKAKTTKKA